MSTGDEATEEDRVRDSLVSFDVNGDDMVDYPDQLGESRESMGSQGSQGSHDEGEDRLGPMEGEVQEPRVLPRIADRAAAMSKQGSKARLSSGIDIETGKQGGARAHTALVSVYRALLQCIPFFLRNFSLPLYPFCSVDSLGKSFRREKSGLPSSQTIRKFHSSKRKRKRKRRDNEPQTAG
jgi:hypothetical protein